MITEETFLQELNDVRIELSEYDYDEETGKEYRYFNQKEWQKSFPSFDIICDLHITEDFEITHVGWLSPEEVNIIGSGVNVDNFVVMLDDGELDDAQLTDFAYRQFLKAISI